MVRSALSADLRGRMATAVTDVERRTHARFALVVVPVSDPYAVFPLAWAVVIATTLMVAIALVRPHLSIGIGVAIKPATCADIRATAA